jgi:hypothetical protein
VGLSTGPKQVLSEIFLGSREEHSRIKTLATNNCLFFLHLIPPVAQDFTDILKRELRDAEQEGGRDSKGII